MNRILTARDVQRVEAAEHWRQGGVETIDTPDAGRIVVKGQRPARSPRLYTALNTCARLLGVPYLKAAPLTGGAASQATEVARLRTLRAAGVRVPQVLHVADQWFAMQWLGTWPLAVVLRRRELHGGALWRAAGNEMLYIHRAGQYLGQAFARNMMVGDDRRLAGMIDFEDDPLLVMSLEDAQARNWLEYVHSTMWLAPLPLPEMDDALDAWLTGETPGVRQRFAHACQRLAWLRCLPSQPIFGRDIIALQAAAAAAHRWLRRHRI